MDKVYIKGIVQNILSSQFTNTEKKKIYDFHDRINFACPYCGDSSKSVHKKRGNIWWNKLLFVCFNCNKTTNFDRMSKDFNQQIDPNKKLEIIEHLNNNISYDDYESNAEDIDFSTLISLEDINRIFNSGEQVITDFKPIQNGGIVYNYLIERGIIPKFHSNIYQAKYWINDETYQNIICFLNIRNSKILGIQIRNLKEGKRRMFKIYNFETLYKWVNDKEEVDDMDINQLIIFNKLSYYFNILNIDFSNPITIFEGYIDSLFFPNSIGVVGVNTDMRFLENKNLDIRYLFDNDDAGHKKSDEKINNGFPVFLWKKLFEDVVKRKKNTDPYKLMERIKKIKDLNKLAELIQDPYKSLKLENYFSKDLFDIKWITKVRNKKYTKNTKDAY